MLMVVLTFEELLHSMQQRNFYFLSRFQTLLVTLTELYLEKSCPRVVIQQAINETSHQSRSALMAIFYCERRMIMNVIGRQSSRRHNSRSPPNNFLQFFLIEPGATSNPLTPSRAFSLS
jgi:hypothetical protein